MIIIMIMIIHHHDHHDDDACIIAHHDDHQHASCCIAHHDDDHDHEHACITTSHHHDAAGCTMMLLWLWRGCCLFTKQPSNITHPPPATHAGRRPRRWLCVVFLLLLAVAP
jgi:cytochrome b561